MTHALSIPSQLLRKYEKRMNTSVFRINQLLARDLLGSTSVNDGADVDRAINRWRSKMSDMIFRFNDAMVRESAQSILSSLSQKNQQLEFILNFIRPELRRYSDEAAAQLETNLRNSIRKWREEGKSPEEVRSLLIRRLDSRGYAKRIASTEAHAALERGSWHGAKALELPMTKEWVTMWDGDVRHDHVMAEGSIVDINEYFVVGGERCMYPGDPRLSAKERANCRCTMKFRIRGRGLS